MLLAVPSLPSVLRGRSFSGLGTGGSPFFDLGGSEDWSLGALLGGKCENEAAGKLHVWKKKHQQEGKHQPGAAVTVQSCGGPGSSSPH